MTPSLTESAPIGTGQVWTVNGHRVSRPDDRNWVVESDDMHGPAYFWRFDRMMAYCCQRRFKALTTARPSATQESNERASSSKA
jgi:hypothetical protein